MRSCSETWKSIDAIRYDDLCSPRGSLFIVYCANICVSVALLPTLHYKFSATDNNTSMFKIS